MDDFATQGTVHAGDSMAALAIVRALMRTLERHNLLSWDDVSSIVKDALAQVEKHSTTVGAQEARRLIKEFQGQFVVRK